jgi:hypothetical protein
MPFETYKSVVSSICIRDMVEFSVLYIFYDSLVPNPENLSIIETGLLSRVNPE